MNVLRGHIMESTEILEMLEPLRNGERGSEGQGGLLEKLAELKELQDDIDKMMIRVRTFMKSVGSANEVIPTDRRRLCQRRRGRTWSRLV